MENYMFCRSLSVDWSEQICAGSLVLHLVSRGEGEKLLPLYGGLCWESFCFLLYRAVSDKPCEDVLIAWEEVTDLLVTGENAALFSDAQRRAELLPIFSRAMENTMYRQMPRLFFEDKIEKKRFAIEGLIFREGTAGPDHADWRTKGIGENGCRLTSSVWTGGAIAAWYPGLLHKLAEDAKDDLYVVFPNLHEARLFPVKAVWKTVRKAESTEFDQNACMEYLHLRMQTRVGEICLYQRAENRLISLSQ